MVAGLFAALTHALWRRSFYTRAAVAAAAAGAEGAALAGAGVALAVCAAGRLRRAGPAHPLHAGGAWRRALDRAHRQRVACAVLALGWCCCSIPGRCCGRVSGCLSARWRSSCMSRLAARVAPAPAGASRCSAAAARTQYAVTLGLVPLTLLLFGAGLAGQSAGQCGGDSARQLRRHAAGAGGQPAAGAAVRPGCWSRRIWRWRYWRCCLTG